MRKINVTLDTAKLLGWQKGNAQSGLVPTSKVGGVKPAQAGAR